MCSSVPSHCSFLSFLVSDPIFTICETETILNGCTLAFEGNVDTSLFCRDMQMNLAAKAPLRQHFKDAQTVQCYGYERSVDSMIWR